MESTHNGFGPSQFALNSLPSATAQVMQPAPTSPTLTAQEQEQRQQHKLNNLFKTQLCKHFVQNQNCVKGDACHFAHGDYELRRKDQQLPLEVQYKMLNIPYNNYKTQVCKYYEQTAQCHFGKNCTYAHGGPELRQPYQELPPDALPSLEITNPGAFRLLNAQVQAFQPRFTQSDPVAATVNKQMLEISQYFQEDQKEVAMQLLQELQDKTKVTGQPPMQPPMQPPAQQQPQSFHPQASPLLPASTPAALLKQASLPLAVTLPPAQVPYHPLHPAQLRTDQNSHGQGPPSLFQPHPQMHVPTQPQGVSIFAADPGQHFQGPLPQGVASFLYTPLAGQASVADRAAWGSPQ